MLKKHLCVGAKLEEEMAAHSSILCPCGQRSLVGCRLWGRREWDTTEAT